MADRNVSYADRVEQRLEVRASTLASAPFQGRLVADSSLRRLSIPDIQYVILYRLEDEAVRIVRLWSTAQDVER